MNVIKKTPILLFILLLAQVTLPSFGQKYEPNWESLAQKDASPQWFEDAVLGIYFHWGIYSVPGNGCWTGMNMYKKEGTEWEHVPDGYKNTYDYIKKNYGEPGVEFGYKDFIPMFKAEKWDPDAWAELFQEAGADFAGPAAVHHDGFELWDADNDDWNTFDMGPKRDIVGEMGDAVKKTGMKYFISVHQFPIWWYFDDGRKMSPKGVDVNDPKYLGFYGDHVPDSKMPEDFQEIWHGKILELVDKYQPDQLWFDGQPPKAFHKEFLSYYFNAAEKWGKEVMVSHKDKALPLFCSVLDIEVGRKDEPSMHKWQTDITLGGFSKRDNFPSWGYSHNADARPINDIIDGIVDRTSKNGVTLLDVAPKADGTLPESQIEGLKEIGKWMSVNKEALYATQPASFGKIGTDQWSADDFRFTRKGPYIYAIKLEKPVAPLTIPNVEAVEGTEIKLLGYDQPLKWRLVKEGVEEEREIVVVYDEGEEEEEEEDEGAISSIIIDELPEDLPGDYAWSFKITVMK